MSRISIDGYIWKRRKVPFNAELLLPLGLCATGPDPVDWVLSWGKKRSGNCSVIESGFWWNAVHIDREIYQGATLNTPEGLAAIAAYKAPKSAHEVVFGGEVPTSKYKQRGAQARWDGVVLALQRPRDRSTRMVGPVEAYYDFVNGACKKYGKRLYMKEHPSGASDYQCWRDMANKYGCALGKVDHSVIEHCEFVLLYNSTFAVDCFLRGVPVCQFAPGYFWKTKAVTYTNGEYPEERVDTVASGSQLADFLIWKYCFNKKQPDELWAKTLALFSSSKELFPLTEELAYGNNSHWR